MNFRCFNADFTSNYANLKIQLEQGSTATSYEPYIEKSIKVDNEDFISMSNLVSVGAIQPSDGRRVWFKKSKNLFNINGGTAEGTQNVSIVIDGNTIKQTNQNNYARSAWKVQGLETNKQYTLSLSFTNTNASSINARVYKSDGSTLITQSDATTNTSGEIELTFTAIENIVYVRLYSNNAQTSNTYEVDFSNIQLEQGSTATTYEPYVEPSINVDEEEWYSKPKVLWTNLAPTSGFASQTITLNDDISNYKYYEILSIGGQGIPNTLYSTGRLSTEKSQTRLNVIRQYLGYREVTINGTSVTFGNYGQMNTYGNATLTTNNTVCLPYKILGYK